MGRPTVDGEQEENLCSALSFLVTIAKTAVAERWSNVHWCRSLCFHVGGLSWNRRGKAEVGKVQMEAAREKLV